MSLPRPSVLCAALIPAAAGLPACARQAASGPADAAPPAPVVAPAPPDGGGPAPAVPLPGAAPRVPADPEDGIDAARLMEHLRRLPTKRAAWGDDAHRDGLRRTETILADALRAMGHAPGLDPVDYLGSRVHDKEDGESRPYHNIIVDLPGTDRAAEVVLLGAHMDAVPGSPGADDNGTGVATVLEAARVLRGVRTRRTVRLVLFTLEEAGLVGSRAYVQRVRPDLEAGRERIVGMISLDMLGFYCTTEGCQRSPLPESRFFKPPAVGDFVGIGGVMKYRTFSQALDRAMHEAEPAVRTVVADFLPFAPPDLMRSDHAPFWAADVPAVILSDTAEFRNPNYHRPTDAVGTIDQERFAVGARAVVGAVYRLAGPEGAPLIDLGPPAAPASPEPAPAPAPATGGAGGPPR